METTWFWAEKTFEFSISAEKSVSILVKTFFFFFWRPPDFRRKKRLNFRGFRQILSWFSEKPCETDSRTMKIRVKVVCTFLILSKKPPLFQILATRLAVCTQNVQNLRSRFCPLTYWKVYAFYAWKCVLRVLRKSTFVRLNKFNRFESVPLETLRYAILWH